MPLTDNQHRFGMQLAQMSRGWRAELDRRLAGLNLSQARWLVLLHLARFEEAPTQRELAQSVGVEGPTLARLLDSLEAQGLVRRQRGAFNADTLGKFALGGRFFKARQMQQHQPARLGQVEPSQAAIQFGTPAAGHLCQLHAEAVLIVGQGHKQLID